MGKTKSRSRKEKEARIKPGLFSFSAIIIPMPNIADTSENILFQLPEVPPPTYVDNALPEHLFKRAQETVQNIDWGPGSQSHYHSIMGRWTANVVYDDEVTEALLALAKDKFNDEDLRHEFNYTARYQIHDGNIPYLWKHMDQNAGNHMIDMCVINNNLPNWGVIVDDKYFPDKENRAICVSSGQQVHSRPPYPSNDPEAYIVIVFSVFTKPNHWWRELDGTQSMFKEYVEKYRWDGEIRFLEHAGHTVTRDGLPQGNKKCILPNGEDCMECYVPSTEEVLGMLERNKSIKKENNA